MRDLQIFRMIETVVDAGSIRKAADELNITASALNRRIRHFEHDFGSEIFERLPRGVRLNPAGNVLIEHIRRQRSDYERVRMDVADLAEMRRGHISIACSQALMYLFLPRQIAAFRARYPGISFTLKKRDRAEAERDLQTYDSDLAVIFEPLYLADFELVSSFPQKLCAIMSRDHALAQVTPLRLSDCLAYPHVLPTGDLGVRHILELAASRLSLRMAPVVEADSHEFMRYFIRHEEAISFQIEIGVKARGDSKSVVREIDTRDVPPGSLFIGKLRDRELAQPVARFADQLSDALAAHTTPATAALG